MELRTASIADGLPVLIIKNLGQDLTAPMITTSTVHGKVISVIRHHLRDVDTRAAFGSVIELLLLGVICFRKVSLAKGHSICICYWSTFHIVTICLY